MIYWDFDITIKIVNIFPPKYTRYLCNGKVNLKITCQFIFL